VNDKSSFEDAAQWIGELRKHGNPGVSILLIGNKKDLSRQVTTNDGAALARKLGVGFMETSAKSGDGVRDSFEKAASEWFERHMGSLDVDLQTDVEEFE
jgi:GTPase SAR1 family protein